MMKRRGLAIGVILVLLLMMTSCGTQQQETKGELRDVTVVLDYVPNTNHTGLYAAKELGYYEDAGLNVTIVEPNDGVTATLIAAGKGDFGISYQEDVTYAVASKDPLPIKAIATIIQHNTSGFASVTSKNITSPKDFDNKVYAGWGAPSEEAVIHAVMNASGADFSTLKMVTADGVDYSALNNTVDLLWMFWAWDGIAATRQGMDLNYIELRSLDERLDYYTPVIIANNNTITQDPEFVKAFMDATTKGYEYAMENPDASAEILHQYASTYDLEMLKESQEYLATKYSEDSAVWGMMKDSVWDGYMEFMVENGLIEKAVPASDCFTNEFLVSES
jgi:ABC-type nitrate/sulfonate/bicarbonate transport system substrate-binding protein